MELDLLINNYTNGISSDKSTFFDFLEELCSTSNTDQVFLKYYWYLWTFAFDISISIIFRGEYKIFLRYLPHSIPGKNLTIEKFLEQLDKEDRIKILFHLDILLKFGSV